jgi:hypothetical protein
VDNPQVPGIDAELTAKVVAAVKEKHTPRDGNRCKTEGCDGEVVSRVSGLWREAYQYGIPACSICGRKYFYARGVPKVGLEEFQKRLSTPFTI